MMASREESKSKVKIWVLRPFQKYFTYIEPIVNHRLAKTGVPGEKPSNLPVQNLASHMRPERGSNNSGERSNSLRVSALNHWTRKVCWEESIFVRMTTSSSEANIFGGMTTVSREENNFGGMTTASGEENTFGGMTTAREKKIHLLE